ncbi:UNVERIFIED_CONTAM: hypothetical protein Slati_3918900 [Sesamum latifolium]|uniref:DUF4216 domain-containing protein n=1 Tax=Sesamum latifolium TaxID=2727402 RepID=A0AAW2TNS0_9LAMI
MCMSSEYIFLTMVIPGPSNPKRLIDVYLEPLIEELQNLWHVGELTHDSVRDETFAMRAALNFKKVYQKNKPFILAQEAVQVYYTEYPSMNRNKVDWMVVCKIKARRVVDDSRWTEVAFQEDETIPTPQILCALFSIILS